MKHHSFIITLFFLICGCTTVEFVRKDFTPIKKGVIRHALTSNPSRQAEYRELVNKEAKNFCGGEFEINKEYQAREETGSSTGVGTGVSIGRRSSIFIGGSDRSTAMYNFIEFVCK